MNRESFFVFRNADVTMWVKRCSALVANNLESLLGRPNVPRRDYTYHLLRSPMASVLLDPDTGIYHIYFRYSRKRFHKSLKTSDVKVGDAWKAQIEQTLHDLERGRLHPRWLFTLACPAGRSNLNVRSEYQVLSPLCESAYSSCSRGSTRGAAPPLVPRRPRRYDGRQAGGPPMSRRMLLRAGLLLGVVLVGALLSPGVRWRLWGWLHGEAFHRGRPTSYWAGRMRGNQRALVSEDMDPTGPTVRVFLAVSVPPWAPLENALRIRLGLGELPPGEVFLDEHDWARAVPVLTALLKDADPQVRVMAGSFLKLMGPEARKAVPALVGALKDDDANVRAAAARALKRIDPQAAAEAGVEDAP